MKDLFNKRSFLINDYISQILVYGSNTNGNIGLSLEDNIILTVSVIKNNYFRCHDIGITNNDHLDFYKQLVSDILNKFKTFDIRFGEKNIIISSKVNNNEIDISFTLLDENDNNWFEKVKETFYNEVK